jgi:hypothetical protein
MALVAAAGDAGAMGGTARGYAYDFFALSEARDEGLRLPDRRVGAMPLDGINENGEHQSYHVGCPPAQCPEGETPRWYRLLEESRRIAVVCRHLGADVTCWTLWTRCASTLPVSEWNCQPQNAKARDMIFALLEACGVEGWCESTPRQMDQPELAYRRCWIGENGFYDRHIRETASERGLRSTTGRRMSPSVFNDCNTNAFPSR